MMGPGAAPCGARSSRRSSTAYCSPPGTSRWSTTTGRATPPGSRPDGHSRRAARGACSRRGPEGPPGSAMCWPSSRIAPAGGGAGRAAPRPADRAEGAGEKRLPLHLEEVLLPLQLGQLGTDRQGHRRAAGQHQRVVVPRHELADDQTGRHFVGAQGVGRPGDPLAALGAPERAAAPPVLGLPGVVDPEDHSRREAQHRPGALGDRADLLDPLQVGGDILGQRVDRCTRNRLPRHNSERSRRSFSGFTATTRAPRSRARWIKGSPGLSTSTATVVCSSATDQQPGQHGQAGLAQARHENEARAQRTRNRSSCARNTRLTTPTAATTSTSGPRNRASCRPADGSARHWSRTPVSPTMMLRAKAGGPERGLPAVPGQLQ